MQKSHEEAVEDSRDELLSAIGEPEDLTFIRLYGNKGDELIYAGTRQLLARRFYKEVNVRELGGVSGHTAVVAGCGGWCGPYHDMVKLLPEIENSSSALSSCLLHLTSPCPRFGQHSLRPRPSSSPARGSRSTTSAGSAMRSLPTTAHSSSIIVPTSAMVRDAWCPTGTTKTRLST